MGSFKVAVQIQLTSVKRQVVSTPPPGLCFAMPYLRHLLTDLDEIWVYIGANSSQNVMPSSNQQKSHYKQAKTGSF